MNAMRMIVAALLCWTCACAHRAHAQDPTPAPATQPGETRKLEHIVVDVAKRQVRVDCEALAVDAPLEFLCVRTGGPEHETVLRTLAKPSDIHLGLLMLGLKPGQPVRYSEAAGKWFPPAGPPVRITLEYQKDGKTVRTTANKVMRNVTTKQPMPEEPWIFVGSRIMDDGNYAADVTGYVISVVNFELTLIDVPNIRSNSNELLEWEADLGALPPEGSPVTMILEPVGEAAAVDPQQAAPAEKPVDIVLILIKQDGALELNRKPIQVEQLADRLTQLKSERPVTVRIGTAGNETDATLRSVLEAARKADVQYEVVTPDELEDAQSPAATDPVKADEARMQALRQRWEKAVRPNADALKLAAQSHYEVILSLREEQQRLIDEADRVQRLIEQLEREYQDITTPRPVD
jgi:hypothetical protein